MKQRTIRLCTLLVALVLLAIPLASCSSRGKTLLTLDKDGVKVTFSVNLYEFMLSRMKGALVSGGYTVNGYTPEQDSFWDYQDKFNGTDMQTLNDYYGDLILENCRTYLAAMWYFESMGLTLSDIQQQSIEDRLDDVLEEHGDGSKTKLNSVLSGYGINYNMLREIYTLEEMVNAVQTAKYGANASLVGHNVKEEYLAQNYVHFKQIFFPYYRYVYVTDANGDTIYYVEESQLKTIAYDKGGYTREDEDGTPITDSNGDLIYYTTPFDYHIAYDTTKFTKKDENGNLIRDENDDIVYYIAIDSDRIAYNTETGYTRKDKNGSNLVDANGDEIYYTTMDSHRIAYDKENGVPSYVLDEDGVAKTEEMTEEERKALQERADELYNSLLGCTAEEFEAAMAEENEESDSEEIYTDGYYLQKNVDYASVGSDFAYFSDIITAMESMEDGDIVKITSDAAGYHIIMKYAPTPGAYDEEINEPWFQNFNSSLVEKLFLDECYTLSAEIEIDEQVLASATDIKRIGSNYYF